jgi:hypothetical protein
MTEHSAEYFEYLRLTAQDNHRHERQKRASTWVVIWLMVAAFGTLLMLATWGKHTYRDPQIVIIVIGGVIKAAGWGGMAINIFRWRDADLLGFADDDDEEDEPPRDIPTGQPQRNTSFNQTHAPSQAETQPAENQTAENQISRVRYKFNRDQWWSLVRSLELSNWRWNRNNLIRAKIFNATNTPGTSLTAPGHFNQVCNEFMRVGIIDRRAGKWRVTEEGKHSMCRAAGLEVIPW